MKTYKKKLKLSQLLSLNIWDNWHPILFLSLVRNQGKNYTITQNYVSHFVIKCEKVKLKALTLPRESPLEGPEPFRDFSIGESLKTEFFGL